MDLELRDGVRRPATFDAADRRPPVGGAVLLHGAEAGGRDHVLYRRTARALTSAGLHVLRFDRREAQDVLTLDQQAEDALAAVAALRTRADLQERPVGLWGWSQGAWVATLAAERSAQVRFVVLVGYSVVSPAEQMRLFTRNRLIDAGFGTDDLAELAEARGAYEDYLRGQSTAQEAENRVGRFRDRAWFPHAWIPDPLPPPEPRRWMVDLDPPRHLQALGVPILAIWGSADDVVPVDEGVRAVERCAPHAVTAVLSDADHALSPHPASHGPVPEYDRVLEAQTPTLVGAA